MILALIIARCRYEVLVRWKWAIYILTNISLVAVQALGTSALGAQRWINVAGFHVQPSEFAKVGIIITLAAILSSKPKVKLFDLFQVLIVTAIPWLLVFLEPNLGTSLIFGVIFENIFRVSLIIFFDLNNGPIKEKNEANTILLIFNPKRRPTKKNRKIKMACKKYLIIFII